MHFVYPDSGHGLSFAQLHGLNEEGEKMHTLGLLHIADTRTLEEKLAELPEYKIEDGIYYFDTPYKTNKADFVCSFEGIAAIEKIDNQISVLIAN